MRCIGLDEKVYLTESIFYGDRPETIQAVSSAPSYYNQ